MKFKLGLVAGVASLAALFSTGAMAASISATVVNYSQEGLATEGTTGAHVDVVLPAFTSIIASELETGDTIVVTISGVTIDAALAPTITCTDPNANTAGLTIGFVNQSAANPNILNFRVTNRSGANGTSTIGSSCVSAGITAKAAALATSTAVAMTWTATTALSNQPEDLLCATASTVGAPGVAAACVPPAVPNATALATVASQYTQSVAQALNGIVDVSTFYLTFATPYSNSNGTVDGLLRQDLAVSITDAGVTLTYPVTTTAVVLDVTGNFSEIPGTAGSCAAASLTGYAAGQTYFTHVPAIAGKCANATITYSTPGAYVLASGVPEAGLVSILQPATSIANPSLPLVAPQTFTGDVTWTYTGTDASAGHMEVNALTVGSWTLNGFQARVGYMPYGSGITQVLYVANKSTEAGTATMTAHNLEGVPCPATGSAQLGAVAADSVTSLATAVNNALNACYGAGFTDKVDMIITATIPQTAGYLFSAYTVGGTSRQIVVNSSNVQP